MGKYVCYRWITKIFYGEIITYLITIKTCENGSVLKSIVWIDGEISGMLTCKCGHNVFAKDQLKNCFKILMRGQLYIKKLFPLYYGD